jgi:hypothetical protein
MRAKTIGLIAAVAAVPCMSGIATAASIGDTYTLSRVGTSGRVMYVNYDGTRAWNAGGVSGGQYTIGGAINWNVQMYNGSASGGTMKTFCVEISEGFPDDPIQYTLADPTGVPEESPPGNMSANQSQMMQDLYSRYYGSVTAASGSWGSYLDDAAAFQLVIWEISHENFSDASDLSVMKSELDITLGALVATDYYSSDVLNNANAMIAALGTGGWNNYSSLFGGTNPTNQDILIVVPSPAIAGLAGLGLVGMRRRRR